MFLSDASDPSPSGPLQANDNVISHKPSGVRNGLKLSNGKGFLIKELVVNPKSSISLQKHNHRSEHWVVVAGEAAVTNGEETLILTVNQSTYIPKQTKHRLENITDHELVIIEVQLGSYLGEDDIVRYEDVYDRIGQNN